MARIEYGDVTIELVGRTVRAANMLGTLRYFLDVDADDDMAFDERIARGTFAALVAHTSAIQCPYEAVIASFADAKRVRTREEAHVAYGAFMDAIDEHVDLYNLWYAAVQQVRQPVGDVALQPPDETNASTRKKKK